MVIGLQNEELVVPENLRKQLADAVRSIQWSYAIFWSTSPAQPGVLQWGEGYYNGDIKTRKTTQAMELDDDLIGLQRSEQLRELYESLLSGEASPQYRRHSAALSPEDLTNAEWYYLVCMSFDFNLGKGLPGRAFGNEQPVWLCNAQYADSKVFSRSLLAKSASIQTVICFPFLQGVVELGFTELVSEDLSLIHRVKTFFLDAPNILTPTGPNSMSHLTNPNINAMQTPFLVEEVASQTNSCDEFRQVQLAEEDLKFRSTNGEASQAQSWHVMEDEFSNCIYSSMTSSDCISQTFFHPDNITSSTAKAESADGIQQPEETRFNLELQHTEDLHYQIIISSLFNTSHTLGLRPITIRERYEESSSFVCWRKKSSQAIQRPGDLTPQRMLKKILFEVPRLHNGGSLHLGTGGRSERMDVEFGPEADETRAADHAVVERRRREKVDERFTALKSLIPLRSKSGKVSVLDNTIAYLKELERRVEELESCQEYMSQHTGGSKRKPQTMVERTSNNCHCNKSSGSSKRKASHDLDEGFHQETSNVSFTYGSSENISIENTGKDIVSIEFKCPWRECLLLEIIDTLSSLHLDSYSVHSSTSDDGILHVTMKSKLKGSVCVSAGMIRQALQRVMSKC